MDLVALSSSFRGNNIWYFYPPKSLLIDFPLGPIRASINNKEITFRIIKHSDNEKASAAFESWMREAINKGEKYKGTADTETSKFSGVFPSSITYEIIDNFTTNVYITMIYDAWTPVSPIPKPFISTVDEIPEADKDYSNCDKEMLVLWDQQLAEIKRGS